MFQGGSGPRQALEGSGPSGLGHGGSAIHDGSSQVCSIDRVCSQAIALQTLALPVVSRNVFSCLTAMILASN